MSNLVKLAPKSQQPFEIRNKSATKAEIVLYGAIGASWFEDSITAKAFSEEIKKLDSTVNEITVRINSPGGDVFDGIAIYNRLKQHPAKIVVYIDGLAASIASIIALAGDEVHIGEGALYMIHLPWTMAMGNRNDIENTVNRLMDVEQQLITIYSKKTKMSRTEIQAMLEKETWMDSDQAIELGFVDQKAQESVQIAASTIDKASWINKRPKLEKQNAAIRANATDLKSKIEDYLKARK